MPPRRMYVLLLALAALAGTILISGAASASGRHREDSQGQNGQGRTATPIKHVIVIFQENVSFDHYFGTYPYAANTDGQTFNAAPNTPAVDGLLPATSSSLPPRLRHSANLLTDNPNEATRSGSIPASTGSSRARGS